MASTCPTSSAGSETESVRVIGLVLSGGVKTSNWAAKSLFAWETGSVMDTQSPFGEITVGLSPFADANASNTATVAEEGCTKLLTFIPWLTM
jgi:hypothetical protein